MKLNSRVLLLLLLIWIVIVGLLFAVIPDKKIASVIAGSGFVLLPLLILVSEYKKNQRNIPVIAAAAVFFIGAALPIFLLRILNWEKDFKDLSLFGIPADFLHRTSNLLYLIMTIAVAFAAYREWKSTKALK